MEICFKIANCFSSVKPAFEEFCIPTKKFADVIVPRGAENTVAIDLIVQHIQVPQQSTSVVMLLSCFSVITGLNVNSQKISIYR